MADIRKIFRRMLEPKRLNKSSIAKRPKSDPRTPFESDYSRVVMSAPVRRLQAKAQVFPLADNDFVRTRLTHSMEVSRFARDMGRGVEEILYRKHLISKKVRNGRWISTILETIGLVHDIGNPPYGHATERGIHEFFKNIPNSNLSEVIKKAYANLSNQQRRDFEFFDGNVQGLRTLLHLGIKDFNLTMPTLRAFVKYSYDSEKGNQPKEIATNHMQKKYGYYDNDTQIYQELNHELGLKENQRHPLTYILEAADDVAYLVCDIEDGVKIGNFSIQDIKDKFSEYNCEDWLNQHNLADIPEDELFIYVLRISMQKDMLNACVNTFVDHFEDIVLGNFTEELLDVSIMGKYKKIFKDLDELNFKSESVKKAEEKGAEVIRFLLNYYTTALFDDKLSYEDFRVSAVSENYWNIACEDGYDIPTDSYKRFMLITDYISGMTDDYALKIYNELKN